MKVDSFGHYKTSGAFDILMWLCTSKSGIDVGYVAQTYFTKGMCI